MPRASAPDGRLEDRELFYPLARQTPARSPEKYRLRQRPIVFDGDLGRPDTIDGIINTTTPNHVHLETTRAAAAQAGKHVFLDKPIANTIGEAQARSRKPALMPGVTLAVGYQRRRERATFAGLRQTDRCR